MRLFFALLLLGITNACALNAEKMTVQVDFYSENIRFDFDKNKLPSTEVRFDEWFARRYYERLKNADYSALISTIAERRRALQLNGWLTYQLTASIVEQLTDNGALNYQRLLLWFLLNELGYDARLAHRQGLYQIQVHTNNNLYETPFFELDKRLFVNLTSIGNNPKSRNNLEFYLIDFVANPKGKALDFDLSKAPKLKPAVIERTIKFWANRRWQVLALQLDQNLIEMMQSYPIVDEASYVERPFSDVLKTSLLPQIREATADLTELEKVQYLLALTRSAFDYKEDTQHFGYNKPMIAEEVFYYAFSDCEDRSALFFNLVKSLLDLPMIIVTYSDHVTIGVQLSQNKGKPLSYYGEAYTICDPTGPSNSYEVGIYPKSYEQKAYEIIGGHKHLKR